MTDTQKLDALDKLIAAVEAGDDAGMAIAARNIASAHRDCGDYWPANEAMNTYRGSLDAALALHNALLPGWYWIVREDYDPEEMAAVHRFNGTEDEVHYGDCMNNPARAWLLAILKAYRAQVAE